MNRRSITTTLIEMRMLVAAMTMLIFASSAAVAANQPCSGKKGGVSHCQGAFFIGYPDYLVDGRFRPCAQ